MYTSWSTQLRFARKPCLPFHKLCCLSSPSLFPFYLLHRLAIRHRAPRASTVDQSKHSWKKKSPDTKETHAQGLSIFYVYFLLRFMYDTLCVGTGTRSEAEGEERRYREGRGEAEAGGTQTSRGEGGVGRGTSQRSGERGAEDDRGSSDTKRRGSGWRISQVAGEEDRERGASPDLHWRHHRRSGMRGLRCNPSAITGGHS